MTTSSSRIGYVIASSTPASRFDSTGRAARPTMMPAVPAGPGSTAVQHLPWALIPTVLMPLYLIVHGIIFAQLRNRADPVRRMSGQPTGELA